MPNKLSNSKSKHNQMANELSKCTNKMWRMAKKIKIHQQNMINGKWIMYQSSSVGLIANKSLIGIIAKNSSWNFMETFLIG